MTYNGSLARARGNRIGKNTRKRSRNMASTRGCRVISGNGRRSEPSDIMLSPHPPHPGLRLPTPPHSAPDLQLSTRFPSPYRNESRRILCRVRGRLDHIIRLRFGNRVYARPVFGPVNWASVNSRRVDTLAARLPNHANDLGTDGVLQGRPGDDDLGQVGVFCAKCGKESGKRVGVRIVSACGFVGCGIRASVYGTEG